MFKGNNRSAVKALEGIASQSDKTRDSLKRGATEESASMDRVRASGERLRGAMVGLAGMVGIGGVAFGLKDLVTGGMALQSQQAQLAAALRATGQAGGGAAAHLKSYAEALSTRGGFATTQNMGALTQYVRETGSATKAQQMLTLATNIARGRNLDLATAQTVVARAYTGSVGRLQQLLGPMVAVKTASYGLSQAHKEEVLQLEAQSKAMGKAGPLWLKQQEIVKGITPQMAALATLTDKHATATMMLAAAQREFGGATSAYANTTQGKISSLKNSFKNMTEELGTALLPTMNRLVSIGSSVAQWMSKNKTAVMALVAAFGALTAAFGIRKLFMAMKGLLGDVAAGFRAVGIAGLTSGDEAAVGAETAGVAWKSFMASTIVGLVLVGLVELVMHWKAVEKVAVWVWHAIENAAKVTWGWIKSNWPLILAVLTGPIGLATLFIVKHFSAIKHAVLDAIHFIEGIFKTLFNILTFPFRKAFDFIKNGFNTIKHIIGGIGHIASSALSTVTGGLLAGGGVVPRHFATGGGPSGSDTVPAWLTPGEGVLTTRAMSMIGGGAGLSRLNSGAGRAGLGGGGAPENLTIHVPVKLDSRVLTEAVVRYALNRAARGPSSLVGGSLVTGAPGLPV